MAAKKKPLAVAEFTMYNENSPVTPDSEPVVAVEKRKRNFRSAEERIAEIDRKIAFHSKSIEQLEAKKGKIGTARRARKLTYAKVLAEAKASGKTPEEIAAFLNS